MLFFTLRRLNLFFFTMLILTALSFSLAYLFPGDALINRTGQINANDAELTILAEKHKIDDNLFVQYITYIKTSFNGDLGLSMTTQSNINQEVIKLLPATIELSIVALIVAMAIGIPIGFFAAVKHRKAADNIILSLAMIGYSIPVFWLGLLAVLVFSIQLSWLPSSGQISLIYEIQHVTGITFFDILLSDSSYKWQAFQNATMHIILPVAVLAFAPATIFIRIARTAMLEVLDTGYIQAAKTKGLSFNQVIIRHATRNAFILIVRHIGLQFANLITLAMVTEVIFNWPGIGRWLIESIYHRDYTAIQSGLFVLSIFIFTVHILSDFMYAALNPLARERKSAAR